MMTTMMIRQIFFPKWKCTDLIGPMYTAASALAAEVEADYTNWVCEIFANCGKKHYKSLKIVRMYRFKAI